MEGLNKKLANLAYARCQRFSVRIQKPPNNEQVDISDQSVQVTENDLPDRVKDAIIID